MNPATLAEVRAELEVALRAGGVDTPAPGEPWVPPCAIVRPADPWLEPARVGPGPTLGGMPGVARMVRHSVLLIAGSADTTAALVELENLAERSTLALSALEGWSAPGTTAARAQVIAGVGYLVAEQLIETLRTLSLPPPPEEP